MPQNRNNPSPPPVMTLVKAAPVLAICIIFDAVRLMFEQFWFFGPALGAVYCTAKIGDTIGQLGGVVAGACSATAGAVGYLANPALVAFGVVMAIVVGLLGWMTVGLVLIIFNGRIFKANEYHTLWFAFSLLISEVPIIGSFPGLTVITWKMYRAQIKKDAVLMKKYQKETEEALLRKRNQRMTELQQTRDIQQEQETENDEEYAQEATDEEALTSEEKSRAAQHTQDKNVDLFGEDALSEFNSKQNHTQEEKMKLVRARKIMENGSILDSEKSDPVLMAAFNRAMRGQEVYDGTPEKRNGFHFSNEIFLGSFGSNTARLS